MSCGYSLEDTSSFLVSNHGNCLQLPLFFSCDAPGSAAAQLTGKEQNKSSRERKSSRSIWHFHSVHWLLPGCSLRVAHIGAHITKLKWNPGTNESPGEDSRQWGDDCPVTRAASWVYRKFPVVIRLQRKIYLPRYLFSFHLCQHFSISHFKMFCQH